MLEVDEAVEQLLSELGALDSENIATLDAVGRVCAASIRATRAQPAFTSSAMDGYAVCTGALPNTSSHRLTIVDEVRAGRRAPTTVAPNEAVRIFTGGPLPSGADAVVPQEEAHVEGATLTLNRAPPAGAHVRPAGEDVRPDQPLISTGRVIGPGELVNLLNQGQLELEVFRRPRVAFVSTGDELVAPGPAPKLGEVTSTNGPMLAATARLWGATPKLHRDLPDERNAIETGFAEAARDCDLMVVTGGMSVGDYDLAAAALRTLGEIRFHRVRMKPGKPIAFGRIGETPVLGLPGNPVSSFVGFELFGRPAIRRLGGHENSLRPRTRTALATRFPRAKSRRSFVRGRFDGGVFRPHPRQGSADASSLLGVEGLAIIESGEGEVSAGEEVTVLDLRRA